MVGSGQGDQREQPRWWRVTNSSLVIALRQMRRLVVLVIGTTIVLMGAVIGPSMILIPTGLAILALEFVWARKLLRRVKTHVQNIIARRRASRVVLTDESPSDKDAGKAADNRFQDTGP